ncbi:hypothetical protein G6F42_016104 [Rhizopus arrhizus]|nr:hypothetical protein G6F42_016104 [Rhizopus arrhizus]
MDNSRRDSPDSGPSNSNVALNVAEASTSAEAKGIILVVPNASRDGETPANTNRYQQKPAKARKSPYTHLSYGRRCNDTSSSIPENNTKKCRSDIKSNSSKTAEQRYQAETHSYSRKRNASSRETERQRPATERKINTDSSDKNKQQQRQQEQ